MREQLAETDRIGGAAPEIEGAPGDTVDPLPRAEIGLDGVGDVEHVADLVTVAVERDRLAFERADQEVRDPALTLGAHLAMAVDAAHPQHGGGDAEAARVIEDILVGRPLRTAIRRVEVERPILSYSVCADRRVGGDIGLSLSDEFEIGEVAVDLV